MGLPAQRGLPCTVVLLLQGGCRTIDLEPWCAVDPPPQTHACSALGLGVSLEEDTSCRRRSSQDSHRSLPSDGCPVENSSPLLVCWSWSAYTCLWCVSDPVCSVFVVDPPPHGLWYLLAEFSLVFVWKFCPFVGNAACSRPGSVFVCFWLALHPS